MTSVQFVGENPNTKTVSNTRVVVKTPTAGGSTGIPNVSEQHDPLDLLVEEICRDNPAFSELLAKAGRELAPLATTREGCVTMTSLRMQAGLTQKQLADKISQNQSNISLIESGQRHDLSRKSMRKFCDALGCDMNTLDAALENTSRALDQHLDAQEAAQIDDANSKKICA